MKDIYRYLINLDSDNDIISKYEYHSNYIIIEIFDIHDKISKYKIEYKNNYEELFLYDIEDNPFYIEDEIIRFNMNIIDEYDSISLIYQFLYKRYYSEMI
jgi:hypothetical protein